MTTSTYSVTGMTCEHCVGAVRAEIGRLPGVREVSVELASGLVSVHSDAPLEPAAVAAAVDEAGYELADPSAG
jgi:copper chaperone